MAIITHKNINYRTVGDWYIHNPIDPDAIRSERVLAVLADSDDDDPTHEIALDVYDVCENGEALDRHFAAIRRV